MKRMETITSKDKLTAFALYRLILGPGKNHMVVKTGDDRICLFGVVIFLCDVTNVFAQTVYCRGIAHFICTTGFYARPYLVLTAGRSMNEGIRHAVQFYFDLYYVHYLREINLIENNKTSSIF